MAGKQILGDGLPSNLAGMSKNQLYEIMSQMKSLIDQNQPQARQILIQNPQLTKALFQAQIMLGMVHPPQAIPNVNPPASQPIVQSAPPPTHQPAQPTPQPNMQAPPSLSGKVTLQEQAGTAQVQPSVRKQHHNHPPLQMSSASVSSPSLQSQPMPSHPLQPPQQLKAHLNPPMTTLSVPHSSQGPNIPSHSMHSTAQPLALYQPKVQSASTQLQQPLQTAGAHNMQLQPPLPPQPRPSSIPNYHNQFNPQMGPSMGFQHPGGPQHISQPVFHAGLKPPPSMGPPFSQGQPLLPNQPPPQPLYQVGRPHLGAEFNNQVGSSMQVDRGSPWMPGPPDNSTINQLQGPSPVARGQMGPGNQLPQPGSLTSDMEKALLQQVMSLTPEQINLLPPEQRNQVLQLQQILRQ